MNYLGKLDASLYSCPISWPAAFVNKKKHREVMLFIWNQMCRPVVHLFLLPWYLDFLFTDGRYTRTCHSLNANESLGIGWWISYLFQAMGKKISKFSSLCESLIKFKQLREFMDPCFFFLLLPGSHTNTLYLLPLFRTCPKYYIFKLCTRNEKMREITCDCSAY